MQMTIKSEWELKTRMEKSFEKLKDYRGKKVKIDYFEFGLPYSEELILKDVNDYVNILARFPGGKTSLSFVGYESVIRQISSADGEVLYENKNISKNEDFRRKNKKDLENLFHSTFGFKGLSSLEPIIPHEANKNEYSKVSHLEQGPRKEFFR